MTLSRLSPYNITDDLLRSDLYREIRTGQTADNDWLLHEIQPDESLLPELVSFRRYQTAELKWLVLIAAKLDDLRERMEAGTTIKLPPIVWVRERIKHYTGEAG